MRRSFACVALLVATFTSHAWEIDNQTGFRLLAIQSGFPTTVNPSSTATCSHLVAPGCVNASDADTQRNEAVTLDIIAIDSDSRCTVSVPGDGKVEVLRPDRNRFKQSASSQSIPSVFLCVASAEFSIGACPYDPPGTDYDAKCVVDAGTGTVEETDRHPYSNPMGERLVRFLGTGDPQYNQAGGAGDNAGNDNADETIASMNSQLALERDIRGVVISGDLTQVAVQSEFTMYKDAISSKSAQYYEGLGNHDLLCAFYGLDWYDNSHSWPYHSACGGRGGYAGEGGLNISTASIPPFPVGADPNVSEAMKSFVYDHTTQSGFPPRTTPNTFGISPHYSWDWHDVHFVQLNLFPGNDVDQYNVEDTHFVDPMSSLAFLAVDLLANALATDGTIGKPVVIMHHYGLSDWCDSGDADGLGTVSDCCSPFWSPAQKRAYWNLIRNYNVVAILHGHTHLNETSAQTSPVANPDWGWSAIWSAPVGASPRAAYSPADIPVVNLAAARGGNAVGKPGVYFDITLDCTNRMSFTRRNQSGAGMAGHTATVNFCSSFPESSCPGESGYQDCDADLDGINDSIEVPHGCLDATSRHSDGDGIQDGVEDLDQDGVVDADETDPCSDDTDDDGYDDDDDNCPVHANADQANADGDDIGDACDPNTDTDGDGVDDSVDNCPDDFQLGGNGVLGQLDFDNDGLSDTDEASASTDPHNPDSDGDGIADGLDRSPDDGSNVASGCSGANAVLSLSVFDTVTCPGTETSETLGYIEVDGLDDVDGPGDLLMIAPVVKFAPGFFVESNASLGVVSSKPDAESEPVCSTYVSTDVPVSIPASGTPTITSTLNVPDSVTIAVLDVSSLSIAHTWINDLDVELISPSATKVEIMARSCGGQDNLSLSLNDEASLVSWPCPPLGGTFQPSNPLAGFDGENGSGTWTLSVTGNAQPDGGSLDGWSLKLCSNP